MTVSQSQKYQQTLSRFHYVIRLALVIYHTSGAIRRGTQFCYENRTAKDKPSAS